MKKSNFAQRGVSLIEALMALAVMAFGMVAVVGVQGTLRSSGDLARQRAEASRIAQQNIEQWRAYTTMSSGAYNYAGIVSDGGPIDVVDADLALNTTYHVRRSVVDLPAPQSGKAMRVTVTWEDRSGQTQTLKLDGLIAGVPPELTGSLAIPPFGYPSRRINDRHTSIPREAVNQSDGTSLFTPPGASGVTWKFSNVTGDITICNPTCNSSSTKAYLLSGIVNFAIGVGQPTPADAESPPVPLPPATPPAFGMAVTLTYGGAEAPQCYKEVHPSYVRYFCAVPYNTANNKWSGMSTLTGITTATSIADPTASVWRVCRYTPIRAHNTTPPAAPLPNAQHPLSYSGVTEALVNQNFLLIPAGDGSTAFDCPADDTSTPYVNGNTWHHQPSA